MNKSNNKTALILKNIDLSLTEELNKKEIEKMLILTNAVTIIQKNWRGYYTRKRVKNLKKEEVFEINEDSLENEEIPEHEIDSNVDVEESEKIDKITKYSITIIVGNRWSSDFTKNMYIFLHGENFDSKLLELAQDVSFFTFK